MARERTTRRWWRVIDWRTVAVAGLPMWALVVAVVVWQKLTPPAVVQLPPDPPPATVPQPPPTEPAPNPPAAVVVKPAEHRETLPAPRAAEEPVAKLNPEVVQALKDGGKVVLQALLTPKPADKPAEKPKPVVPDGCKTYDTALLFVKNLAEAQKRAKADGKLVLVLHLSGNIDDPGFT